MVVSGHWWKQSEENKGSVFFMTDAEKGGGGQSWGNSRGTFSRVNGGWELDLHVVFLLFSLRLEIEITC